jgi:hypothetical protein
MFIIAFVNFSFVCYSKKNLNFINISRNRNSQSTKYAITFIKTKWLNKIHIFKILKFLISISRFWKKSFLIWFARFFIISSKKIHSRMLTSRFRYFKKFLKKEFSIAWKNKFTFRTYFNNLSLKFCWINRKNDFFLHEVIFILINN